jgi:hypothetical protein
VPRASRKATTREIPSALLAFERTLLQGLPSPYAGRSARSIVQAATRKPVIGYQHPLSLYEELAATGGLS